MPPTTLLQIWPGISWGRLTLPFEEPSQKQVENPGTIKHPPFRAEPANESIGDPALLEYIPLDATACPNYPLLFNIRQFLPQDEGAASETFAVSLRRLPLVTTMLLHGGHGRGSYLRMRCWMGNRCMDI